MLSQSGPVHLGSSVEMGLEEAILSWGTELRLNPEDFGFLTGYENQKAAFHDQGWKAFAM